MPITALALITVTGRYLLINGSPAQGTVTFKPSVVLVDNLNNEIVFPVPFVRTLDINGAFSIQLPATDDPDLAPTGWTYIVKEEITGAASARDEYAIQVPYNTPGATLDLARVSPVINPAIVSSYVLVDTFNEHLNDAVDSHDASSISFVPAGTIAATNVQAAIQEVAAEGGTGGSSFAVVDAKGDLIVGTAADTVARLPVGTNGKVLSADSLQVTGLTWSDTAVLSNAMPLASGVAAPGTSPEATRSDHVHPVSSAQAVSSANIVGLAPGSGYVSSYSRNHGSVAQAVQSLNRLNVVPVAFDKSKTLDRIGTEVTTAATGAFIRFGLYTDLASGLPGSLILDTGQIAANTTGLKLATISQAVTAGVRYWVAWVCQGAAVNIRMPEILVPLPYADFSSPWSSYRTDNISGALPATHSITAQGDEAQIVFRAAA